MSRLKNWYKNVVRSDLVYKANVKNLHGLLRLDNVVLKSTINTCVNESKDILFGLVLVELLSSQKAKLLRTKKSVAAFKTRKFVPFSSKVTLRKNSHCYLDFFVSVVLPRAAQVKEISKNSVGVGENSLSLGLTNLTIFPQLNKESDHLPKDVGITLTLNFCLSKNQFQLLGLLSQFQFPVKL